MHNPQFLENIPLAPYTTFHIGGPARYFVEVKNIEELKAALNSANSTPPLPPLSSPRQSLSAKPGKRGIETFILGGGSNILVSDKGFNGLVIKNQIKDLSYKIKGNFIEVKVGAGNDWDELVKFCVDRGWWGIENLSGIPGTIGGAPVQNIGAYGQELSETLVQVEAYDIKQQTKVKLKNQACGFSYRRSIFNNQEAGRYIVLTVVLRLKKRGRPNISYPDVQKYFQAQGISRPTLKQIRAAILSIRQKKFADPKAIGTAGSFFKNIYLTEWEFEDLKDKIKQKGFVGEIPFFRGPSFVPTIVGTSAGKRHKKGKTIYKIPAAFLIDKICQLKGLQIGGARVSEQQALAIVNATGKASADDVLQVFKKVRQEVYAKTSLVLPNESQFIGFSEKELNNYFDLNFSDQH